MGRGAVVDADLLKKLQYKGGPMWIVNAPDGYADQRDTTGAEGRYPWIQVFVTSADDVHGQLRDLLAALEPDGLFWLTYPKQSSGIRTDINRDVLANLVQEQTAYRVVSNVSIDRIWSALRLREKARVKSRS